MVERETHRPREAHWPKKKTHCWSRNRGALAREMHRRLYRPNSSGQRRCMHTGRREAGSSEAHYKPKKGGPPLLAEKGSTRQREPTYRPKRDTLAKERRTGQPRKKKTHCCWPRNRGALAREMHHRLYRPNSSGRRRCTAAQDEEDACTQAEEKLAQARHTISQRKEAHY